MQSISRMLSNVTAYSRVDRLLLSIATGDKSIIPAVTYSNTEDILKYMATNGIGVGGHESSLTSIIKIVSELPSTGEENKIYLVSNGSSEDSNTFDEYLFVEGNWEKLGSTILSSSVSIDDSIVSSDSTWSSAKIKDILDYELSRIDSVVGDIEFIKTELQDVMVGVSENNDNILSLDSKLSDLENSVNQVKGVEITELELLSDDFIKTDGLFEVIINHGLNAKIISISGYDELGESVFLSHKVIDNNKLSISTLSNDKITIRMAH